MDYEGSIPVGDKQLGFGFTLDGCIAACKDVSQATGCNFDKKDGGCYVRWGSIFSGSGHPDFTCWKFVSLS